MKVWGKPAVRGLRGDSQGGVAALVVFIGIGLVWITVYATHDMAWTSVTSTAIPAAMLAGASLIAGGVLGFLFGIPRTFQGQSNDQLGTPVNGGQDYDNSVNGGRYRPNTNLEQISDWLTKILVGVGLTQIGAIPDLLRETAAGLKLPLGNRPESGVLGAAIVVYFLLCGFLLGYLWTRVFFSRALVLSDAYTESDNRKSPPKPEAD